MYVNYKQSFPLSNYIGSCTILYVITPINTTIYTNAYKIYNMDEVQKSTNTCYLMIKFCNEDARGIVLMTKMWLANWLPQLNHFREVNENRSLQHACQYKDLAHADIFQDVSSYFELLIILVPRRLTCNHDLNISNMSTLNLQWTNIKRKIQVYGACQGPKPVFQVASHQVTFSHI